MNYGKYDTICCKRCFYLLICNELFCIDSTYQLLMITNTINKITIQQTSIFNVFLHGYFLQCRYNIFQEKKTKNQTNVWQIQSYIVKIFISLLRQIIGLHIYFYQQLAALFIHQTPAGEKVVKNPPAVTGMMLGRLEDSQPVCAQTQSAKH